MNKTSSKTKKIRIKVKAKKKPKLNFEDTLAEMDKNNDPIIFDSSFSDRYSGLKQTEQDKKHWILNDKKVFPQFIYSNENNNFSMDIDSDLNTRAPLKIWNNRTNSFKNISPFKHQKFVSDYLNDNSPYRGLLLYHGLGSGKSGASIMIAEGYRQRQIVVLLPKSLRQNYEDEIQTFGDIAYRKMYHWCFIPVNLESTDKNSYYELFESKGIKREHLDNLITKKSGGNGIWMIDSNKSSPNYNTLSANERREIDIQITKMYNAKYIFVHYNAGKWTLPQVFNQLSSSDYNLVKQRLFGHAITDTKMSNNQMSKLVHEFVSNDDIANPFDNKVIVIDEVHNLGSLMAGGGFTGPHLYQLLISAKNCKIVMLSGTPVINNAYELALIFNILKGIMYSWKLKLDNINWNHDELHNLLYSYPFINRININSSHKTIEITRNPIGFRTVYDESGKRKGLIKDDSFNINNSEFIHNLLVYLIEHNYTLTEDTEITKSEYKLFPDSFRKQQGVYRYISKLRDESENIFNDYYIDYNTFEVKNKMSFKTRILGMVSFYNEISGIDSVTGQKLFPEKIYASTEETKVTMSDYQFMIYTIGREIERELELKSKKSSYNQSSEIQNMSKNKTPNLFRVLSRQSGIAVFPPGLKRPRPKDFKLDKSEQEVKNKYLVIKSDIKNLLMEICNSYDNDLLINDFVNSLQLEDQDNLDIYSKMNTFKKMFQIKKDSLSKEDVISQISNVCENSEQLYKKDIEEENYQEACLRAINEINPDHLNSNSNIYHNLDVLSPKYSKIIDNISKTHGLVFCYSQFRSVEGIEIFSRVLMSNGYRNLNNLISENLDIDLSTINDRLSVGRVVRIMTNEEQQQWKSAKIKEVINDNEFLIEFLDKEPCNKPSDCENKNDVCINSKCTDISKINDTKVYNRNELYPAYFALWTGTESVDERSRIQEIFNDIDNRYGQHCLMLLATASGAEGISLMNVRQVHIMEPYWNNVRIEQVIGRARRIKSHVNLLPYQQNVKIYQYIISFSDNQLNGQWGKSLSDNDFIDYENKRSDKIKFLIETLVKLTQECILLLNTNTRVIDPIDDNIDEEALISVVNEIISQFEDSSNLNNPEYDLSAIIQSKISKLLVKINRFKDEIIKLYSHAEQIGEKFINNWESLTSDEITSRKNSIIQRLTQQITTLDGGLTSDEVLQDISEKKTKILYEFLFLLKEAAVDCVYNKNDNIQSNPDNSKLNCTNIIPVKGDFTFEISNDLTSVDEKLLESSVTKDVEHEFILTLKSKLYGDFKIILFTPKEYSNYQQYLEEHNDIIIYNYYSYYNLDYSLPNISGTKDQIGSLNKEGQIILEDNFKKKIEFYTEIQGIIDNISHPSDNLIEWSNNIKFEHRNLHESGSKSEKSSRKSSKTWKCMICNKILSYELNNCPTHTFYTKKMYLGAIKSQKKL